MLSYQSEPKPLKGVSKILFKMWTENGGKSKGKIESNKEFDFLVDRHKL